MERRLHVVVDDDDELVEGRGANLLQSRHHFCFAHKPMPNQFFDLCTTVRNNITVTGSNSLKVIIKQALKRFNIGLHIPARGDNHDRGTIHYVITGEHHAFLLEQEAVVIIHMPGGMNRP